MIQAIQALFVYPFMTRALIAGVLLSLCSALLGVNLVLKRYSMIGDGLSHVGFGALAVATAAGFAPLAVAIPVVVIAAVLLLRFNGASRIGADAAIALISTSALAAGVMAVSLSTGMNMDIMNYMFGSVLAMTKADVVLSVCLCAAVLILFVICYNHMFCVTFDETFSTAIGMKTDRYNLLLAVLTAVTIVLGMRMMGALLISSLIIFPALTAMRLCGYYRAVVIVSAVISVVCFVIGLLISFAAATPTGASIVLVNLAVFLAASLIAKIRGRA